MKCLNCGEFFIVKKNINTLFKEEKYLLCNECHKKYPITITTNFIPVSDNIVKIFSLFKEFHFINKDAFIIEYSSLVKYLYSLNKDIFFLLVDKVKIDENFIEGLEIINKLIKKDIYVVSYF